MLLQIVHIAADVVEAKVHIVAVILGIRGGIVADGTHDTRHDGVFFSGKGALYGQMQIVGILEDVADLLHEHSGPVEHKAHDGSHTENHQDASDSAPDDLAERLLDLAGGVEGLSNYRCNGKAEGQHDADQRHGPIDIADGLIGEKDVDQILGRAVIFDLDKPCEDLEHLIQQSDDPAKNPLYNVTQPKDGGMQNCLQNGAHGAAHPVGYLVPKFSEQVVSLPSQPISSRLRLMKI